MTVERPTATCLGAAASRRLPSDSLFVSRHSMDARERGASDSGCSAAFGCDELSTLGGIRGSIVGPDGRDAGGWLQVSNGSDMQHGGQDPGHVDAARLPRLGADPVRIRMEDLVSRLPLAPTARWPDGVYDIPLLQQEDGTEVLLFAPRGKDCQQPHDRDEFYVVVRGTGTFEVGGRTLNYAPGDLLYVPRNVPHRFLPPLDELVTWVFFLPRALEGRAADRASAESRGGGGLTTASTAVWRGRPDVPPCSGGGPRGHHPESTP